MTATYEQAVCEFEQKLEPIRQHRAKVLAIAKQTLAQVTASKSWANVTAAANDCRQAFQALSDYRDMLGKIELSFALKPGGIPPVVKSLLGDLRIHNHGAEIDVSPLYRILGDEVDQKAAFARIERILKTPPTRQRSPIQSRVYKLYGGGRADVAQRINANPAINEAEMSVTMTICTDAVDRQQEVIIPSGVDITDYRRNPVVLWEHGLDPSFPTAIARCETPDGRLALQIGARSITATAYFIRGDADSERIWNLVRAKCVRAASIHVLPKPGTRKVQTINGVRATVYPLSSMIEWSLGNIPVNQEATL